MKTVTAQALANVALVKYFGKRDTAYNLPAAGSLSITLEPLHTTTTIAFDRIPGDDCVTLNGETAGKSFLARTTSFLDLLRSMSDCNAGATVSTTNDFPTAAGLASSASGFAALCLAATTALRIPTTEPSLSALARRGSGSAARSSVEGFVVWDAGNAPDGSDSFARSIAPASSWDLRIIVGIAATGPKSYGSTNAMEHTRRTSPYYSAFIDTSRTLLKEAEQAVLVRDFEKLGDITEHSALAMHAAILASRPTIPYFNGTTMNALHLVHAMRQEGVSAWFTCDAGPQPKILCQKKDEDYVCNQLAALPGISGIIRCRPGIGARILSET